MSVQRILKTAAVATTLTAASVASAAGPGVNAQHYGNQNFGAGYMVNLGYRQYDPSYTKAHGQAGIYGRVFGRQLTVVDAKGVAQSNDNVHTTNVEFNVLGVTFNPAVPGVGGMTDLVNPITRTFFKKQQTFMAGPIPLSVKGEVTGSIGVQGQLNPGASGVGVTVRPYANLSGSAEVAVGVACV